MALTNCQMKIIFFILEQIMSPKIMNVKKRTCQIGYQKNHQEYFQE
jgi:hypothetical protein